VTVRGKQYLSDRLTGLVFVAVAVLLFWVIIPWQTETVEQGWLTPDLLPSVMAVVIGVCGVALAVLPGTMPDFPLVPVLIAGNYATILFAGLILMSTVGFLWSAPVLALVIMLVMGERRILWLALGAAGMPAAIWYCVVILLERPLP